jgi:predicted helicase
MTPTPKVRPSDPAIKAYHAGLKALADHRAAHEGATETAFSRLLADTARARGWTLIPKKGMKAKATGRPIYPDGTLEDAYYLPRGYWEAKDTADDLDAEITKKRAAGYPLANTIFEDTRTAALYQDGKPVDAFDLTDPGRVADLLNAFYGYAEPDIRGFERAVDEFAGRVPDLGRALAETLTKAHADNPAFRAAFDRFYALCQASLNPNIRREAVDEMLVQHLLTERLFRTIFAQSDFVRKNAIAAEVETVVDALTGRSFSRDAFLKSLDRFYKAIEKAADTIEDFSQKQHFLNTVYERFFQGYSVRTADTHGIVYTPQAVVDFMCASVEEVLEAEWGLTLGSKEVRVLDPCTGTGNFAVNLLRRVPGKDLADFYRNRLFANEVMLLPYYIAALNVEHAYFERTGAYEPFEGLCFVDTLDLVFTDRPSLPHFGEKNSERVDRQQATRITVIVGNPPYNVGQLNENDNNKNRKYDEIDRRVRQTYVKDSTATSVSKLNDPYVKFFRWASDRLKGSDGVVCFVTNNSFVDKVAFDGMRKHLLKDFSRVYHLDLEGEVRENPNQSGTAYNVFGIQVGVGITVAVKSAQHTDRQLLFYRIDKRLRRREKLAWLEQHATLGAVPWSPLTPDPAGNWIIPENSAEFSRFIPIGSKEGKAAKPGRAKVVFKEYSLGVATHRDSIVYGFDRAALGDRIASFSTKYNAEVDRFRREGDQNDAAAFEWTEAVVWDRDLKQDAVRGISATFKPEKLRKALYRPFGSRWLYLDRLLNAEVYSQERHYPTQSAEVENRSICLTTLGSQKPFLVLIAGGVVDLHLVGAGAGAQCFPFYVYDADGSRQENVTDWALKQFRGQYKDRKITKWDVFHYVYGLLHHPGYRARFADNLKKSLPRIPFAPDFRAFAAAGQKLAELHLNYEAAEPWPLGSEEAAGGPYNPRVLDKMKLSKDKTRLVVNPSLTLTGLPPEAFEYRLGNRSAVEWVIDQYRVTEDKRSGVRSDPNRPDDPGYIVGLVGRVVRVSVETVRIVAGLPPFGSPPEAAVG